MAVVLLRLAVVEVVIVLFKPLFEKTCLFAYTVGFELDYLFFYGIAQFFILAECFACCDKVAV